MRYRRWLVAMVVLAGAVAAAAATVLAIAVNVATGGTTSWWPSVQAHPLRWSAAATAGVAVAGVLVWWAQQRYDRARQELVPAALRPESWVLDRPAEVQQVVSALLGRARATVGISTAVQGAGGFGKTTIAQLVRADSRILRRFGGRVYWVTLGRDVRSKETITGKVNDLLTRLDPERPVTFTEPQQAAEHLAAVLAAGPPRLLVLDDVWYPEQLAAFPVAGERSRRLITTRIASLAADSVPVRVDEMTEAQARALVTAGLPALPRDVVDQLVATTGRWPLLLRLVNKVLAAQLVAEPDVAGVARELLDRLRHLGAAQIDVLSGAASARLDIDDPEQRRQAVTATVDASRDLLAPAERARFAELAVFAEDETVPVRLIARLWEATGGLDLQASRTLCARLGDLALVSAHEGTVSLHDEIRDFLRHEHDSLAQLHRALLDAVAARLPRADDGRVAWWELDQSERYLWDHLVEHLVEAETGTAEEVAGDLRWITARLDHGGPIGAYVDLGRIGTPVAQRLQRLLGQTAPLLGLTEPAHSRADILCSRVAHDPFWREQADQLARSRTTPGLVNRWPIPDPPDSRLRNVLLTAHSSSLGALAIAPNGAWVAMADDGPVRLWDATTGQFIRALAGPSDASALAISPDGRWLAVGKDRTIEIRDPVSGELLRSFTGQTGRVRAIAIAPDGTWLATGSSNGTVRLWETRTGRQLHKLTGHANAVNAVAISPCGTWMATAGDDQIVRLWDVADGSSRGLLIGNDRVRAVAISPDGTWLVTAGPEHAARIWRQSPDWHQRTLDNEPIETGHAVAITPDGNLLISDEYATAVSVWDPATGEKRQPLVGHTGSINAFAISHDGAVLATGSTDRTVRIWDTSRAAMATPAKHGHQVSGITMSADGTSLVSAGGDGTIRIWDVATGAERRTLTGHAAAVDSVALSPDGTLLVSAGADRTFRMWNFGTGKELRRLPIQDSAVEHRVAFSPDGTWFATGSRYGTLHIRDAGTGEPRHTVTDLYRGVWAMAIAPDGRWIAVADFTALYVIDVATGHRRQLADDGYRWMNPGVAIAPDGTWLALAVGRLGLWDLPSGRARKPEIRDTKVGDMVAISPDGGLLAEGGRDHRVRLWDTATSRPIATMLLSQPAKQCTWSPDGRSLAVCGPGGLYLFDVRRGQSNHPPQPATSVAVPRLDAPENPGA